MRQRNRSHRSTVRQNSKFAPAGYGLGESNALSVEDCNTAVKTGLYSFAYNTINRPEHLGYGVIFPIARLESSNAKEIIQIAKGCGTGTGVGSFQNRITAVRSTEDGITWTEWEYENPPMVLGVEYRTTERWNGQSVYVKLVDCGQGPATGAMNLFPSVGTNIVYTNLACKARNTVEGFCIMLDNYLSAFEYPAGNNTVALNYTKDLSDYNIYLTVKYYKV